MASGSAVESRAANASWSTTGARRDVRKFGQQCGVGKQMRRQQIGGGRADGRIGVVPEVRGQAVGEPGVDVLLHVRAGPPGEFVPGGFVALAGLGLLQRAELAQRLELIGASRDPGGFAQLGFPGGGLRRAGAGAASLSEPPGSGGEHGQDDGEGGQPAHHGSGAGADDARRDQDGQRAARHTGQRGQAPERLRRALVAGVSSRVRHGGSPRRGR